MQNDIIASRCDQHQFGQQQPRWTNTISSDKVQTLAIVAENNYFDWKSDDTHSEAFGEALRDQEGRSSSGA